uniref:Uncharacterized protein n=1 Tax=Chelonoidis abingdonii TaxID=106734 RepID=A0A8C0G683_CHEAB
MQNYRILYSRGTEIAKRLNVICAQLIPFLSQEVSRHWHLIRPAFRALSPQHQLQAQHLSHHAPPIPLTSHPSSMQPASIGAASGLLALSGALGAQGQLLPKDNRGLHDSEHRGRGRPG